MPQVNEQAIQQALQDLKDNKYPSIRAAASAHAVSRVTLSARLGGGQTRKQARQTQLLLSPAQENVLKRWILNLEAIKHPPNYDRIREMVGLINRAFKGPISCGL
jgi:hypothetical protein